MNQSIVKRFWEKVQEDEELAHQRITAQFRDGLMYLAGTCASWDQVVRCGHIAGALPGVKGVINDIEVRG